MILIKQIPTGLDIPLDTQNIAAFHSHSYFCINCCQLIFDKPNETSLSICSKHSVSPEAFIFDDWKKSYWKASPWILKERMQSYSIRQKRIFFIPSADGIYSAEQKSIKLEDFTIESVVFQPSQSAHPHSLNCIPSIFLHSIHLRFLLHPKTTAKPASHLSLKETPSCCFLWWKYLPFSLCWSHQSS